MGYGELGVLSLPRKRLLDKGSGVSYHSLEKDCGARGVGCRLWGKGSWVFYYSLEKDYGIRGVGCLITP